MIICLGRPLPERLDATDPGVMTPRDTRLPLYAVLLQVGFAKPAPSPGPLVRSYRTVSPLPAAPRLATEARWRFVFCCTFRGLAPPGDYPAPCPVEFGLSSAEALVHRVSGSFGFLDRDHLGDSDPRTRSSVSLTSWSARTFASRRTDTYLR